MNSKLGKPERGEVSVRQSDVQRWGLREVPRSIGAARRFRGVLRSDATLAELSISCGSSFPLFPDHRPKSPIHPRRYSVNSWTIRARLIPRVRRVSSRTRSLNRATAFGAKRLFGCL